MKYIQCELKNNQKELLQALARAAQEQLSGGQSMSLTLDKGDAANESNAANLNLLNKVTSQPQTEASTGAALEPGFRWNHNETIVEIA
ncbi:MAG: hypothetical protein AAFW75_17610 [Cyanobacteria bacterium J06636_16]